MPIPFFHDCIYGDNFLCLQGLGKNFHFIIKNYILCRFQWYIDTLIKLIIGGLITVFIFLNYNLNIIILKWILQSKCQFRFNIYNNYRTRLIDYKETEIHI